MKNVTIYTDGACSDINCYSRAAQGVKIMNLDEGVRVISIARTDHEEEEESAQEEPEAETMPTEA